MLQYILTKYQKSIQHFEHNLDLRISFCYVLNDLALYKNEALATAEYCSTLGWSLQQGVAICQLLTYLEEEEVTNTEGLGTQIQAPITSRTKQKLSKNWMEQISGALWSASQGLDVKTYNKRVKLRRKKFFDSVLSCLSKYDDLWRELSLESPELIKVKAGLLVYHQELVSTKKFIQTHEELVTQDPESMLYHSLFQKTALNQIKESLATL